MQKGDETHHFLFLWLIQRGRSIEVAVLLTPSQMCKNAVSKTFILEYRFLVGWLVLFCFITVKFNSILFVFESCNLHPQWLVLTLTWYPGLEHNKYKLLFRLKSYKYMSNFSFHYCLCYFFLITYVGICRTRHGHLVYMTSSYCYTWSFTVKMSPVSVYIPSIFLFLRCDI